MRYSLSLPGGSAQFNIYMHVILLGQEYTCFKVRVCIIGAMHFLQRFGIGCTGPQELTRRDVRASKMQYEPWQ